MNNEIHYMIKRGDILYQLAKNYQTTVQEILNKNPHLDPYHLEVGTYIVIPVATYPNQEMQETLKDKMRKAWDQHVFWTRLLIISIVDGLQDEQETAKRLLRNPDDLANLFRPYYGDNAAEVIKQLLTDHLVIAAQLVQATINNQMDEATRLNDQWYRNADQIAAALTSINPYYNEEEVRRMLYSHLDLTKQEVMYRINKNYANEIQIFDQIENQALMMADYFVQGINRQFNLQ